MFLRTAAAVAKPPRPILHGVRPSQLKIALIHNERKIGTGAHQINDLMSTKLRERGIKVKHFYPRTPLIDHPHSLKGLANILFFYNLVEHKQEVLRYSLVQGTTYTPLPFLAFDIPVVSHFGSTTQGFLDSTPRASEMERATRGIWYRLRESGVISELNIKTRRPLRDIAEIEHYVATRAAAVIATSQKVKRELIAAGVSADKVKVIHNAIEDYWFEPVSNQRAVVSSEPSLVFLGRTGGDAFTLKLKGVDRLIHLYSRLPEVSKISICMTTNKKLKEWLKNEIPKHSVFTNMRKDLIPNILRPLRGGILFVPSRYEGFSLSLVEGMSQGLVPVSYPVGVAPEIIEDGRNGYIVSNQSEAVERVKGLLADKEQRERLSLAAVHTALEFRSDTLAANLDRFYRDTLRHAED